MGMEIHEGILDNFDAKNKALVFVRETVSDKKSQKEEFNGFNNLEEKDKQEFETLKTNILDKISRRNVLEYKVNISE